MLLELGPGTQQDRGAVMGPGDDQPGPPGIEPRRGVAAQAEQQQNRLVVFAAILGRIDGVLDDVPKRVAVRMLAQFGELDVDHMRRSSNAPTCLSLKHVAGDQF